MFSLRQVTFLYNHMILNEVPGGEEYERIMTIERALSIVSDELSEYKTYDVKYIALENRVRTDEPSETNTSGMPARHGEKATSIPCWVVYLETTYNREIYAVVNAITGELDFFDNTRGA